MYYRQALLALGTTVLWLTISLIGGCTTGGDNPNIGNRVRSSAALSAFHSCDELETALKQHLKEEMQVQIMSYRDMRWGNDLGTAEGGEADFAAADSGDSAPRQEGVDYSGTNNQETGVDEADFVKTDGYHIYVLNGNRLEILGVPEFGELTEVSSTSIEGHPRQMLMHNDPQEDGDERAVVFSMITSYNIPEDHPLFDAVVVDSGEGWYRIQNLTKLTIIDISDPSSPQTVRELYLEGWYQTARRVESSVHMVSHGYLDVPGLIYWVELPSEYYQLDYDDPRRKEIYDEAAAEVIAQNNEVIDATPLESLVPRIYERLPDGSFTEHSFVAGKCGNFHMAEDAVSRGVSSIMSLDLLGAEFGFDADHIITNWPIVYASQDVMLLAEPSQGWWWYWNNDDYEEATNIHRFDITSSGEAEYTGSGRVDGLLRNQFSLSEYQGYVRVAATTGRWNRWWLPIEEQSEEYNHVYVLSGETSLEQVGAVTDIAEGEQIWSSRFVGDKAFLVTFEVIDPLWTIDLSDPTNPHIVGELEVPGVSTYIHPMDGDSFLLTIGYGGDDTGLDWRTQVSLFSVEDFSNPALVDNLSMVPTETGDGWYSAWSEAMYEHKAFQYWGPMSMLAIPLSTYRYDSSGYEYLSLLRLISVDTAAGLEVYGEIDHSDFFNSESNVWWDYRDIRRSIFMGDYIYAISNRGVTAHLISDMSLSAQVSLPGNIDDPYWFWW